MRCSAKYYGLFYYHGLIPSHSYPISIDESIIKKITIRNIAFRLLRGKYETTKRCTVGIGVCVSIVLVSSSQHQDAIKSHKFHIQPRTTCKEAKKKHNPHWYCIRIMPNALLRMLFHIFHIIFETKKQPFAFSFVIDFYRYEAYRWDAFLRRN